MQVSGFQESAFIRALLAIAFRHLTTAWRNGEVVHPGTALALLV